MFDIHGRSLVVSVDEGNVMYYCITYCSANTTTYRYLPYLKIVSNKIRQNSGNMRGHVIA